jgi:hypothetical protein
LAHPKADAANDQTPHDPLHTPAPTMVKKRTRAAAVASGDEAWRIAEERFPEDRRDQIAHPIVVRVVFEDPCWRTRAVGGSAH